MCGACGGGQPVSKLAATLNHERLKRPFAAELQQHLNPGYRVRVFGDRWVLTHPTGRQQLFDTPEELLGVLAGSHLVSPPAHAATASQQLLVELLAS